jgi:hypothetical protein
VLPALELESASASPATKDSSSKALSVLRAVSQVTTKIAATCAKPVPVAAEPVLQLELISVPPVTFHSTFKAESVEALVPPATTVTPRPAPVKPVTLPVPIVPQETLDHVEDATKDTSLAELPATQDVLMESISAVENAPLAKLDAPSAQLPINVLLAWPNNSSATTSASPPALQDTTEDPTESA